MSSPVNFYQRVRFPYYSYDPLLQLGGMADVQIVVGKGCLRIGTTSFGVIEMNKSFQMMASQVSMHCYSTTWFLASA